MPKSFLITLVILTGCGPKVDHSGSSFTASPPDDTLSDQVGQVSDSENVVSDELVGNEEAHAASLPLDGAPERATLDERGGRAVLVVGDRFSYEGGSGQIVVEPSTVEAECSIVAIHEHAGRRARASQALPCWLADGLALRSIHLADLDGDHEEELYFSLRLPRSASSIWFALDPSEDRGKLVPARSYAAGGYEMPVRGYALPAGDGVLEQIGRALWLGLSTDLREVAIARAGDNRYLQGEFVLDLTPTGIGHPNKSVLVEYGRARTDNSAFRRVLGSRHDGGFTRFYAGDVDDDGDEEFFVLSKFGCSDCFQQPAEVWGYDNGQSLLLATGVLDSVDYGTADATAIENVGPVEAHVLRLRARDHRRRIDEQVEPR